MTSVRVRTANKIPDILATAKTKTERAIKDTATGINNRTKVAMREPKSGRIYGSHQASAPGEPPAVDTGKLISSLKEHYSSMRGIAYTTVDYSVYLEFGIVGLQPRPFYIPAAKDEYPELIIRMRGVFQ